MSERQTVREFITHVLSEIGDTDGFADDESLVTSGRLSSLDVVNTLVFLEGRFGFNMDPADFDPSKFDTVDSIVSLLETVKQ
jgi:acyl carrier protein